MDSINTSLFQRIQDSCIKGFWHLVCHQSSVASHGEYFGFQLGETDLFIHNHLGDFSCYVNRCPHRGARIVTSLSGQSALQCSYHGWSFQPSGTSVPRFETFSLSSDPRLACLTQWNLVNFAGFIFVSLDPLFSLEDQIGDDAMCLLEQIGEGIRDCYSSHSIHFDSPWMLAVENALESYHVSKVHPQTLATVDLDDGCNSLWSWSSFWHASSRSKKVSRLASVIASYVDIPSRINGYFSLYLFPFSMLSSTESLSIALQVYQPSFCVKDCKTSLRTTMYVPLISCDRMRDSVSEFYHSASEMNKRIFEEDSRISSCVPLDSWSIEPLIYASSLEVKIDHFRQCCKRALRISSAES